MVWESDRKQQENITYKGAKRSAVSQQVTTRAARNRHDRQDTVNPA